MSSPLSIFISKLQDGTLTGTSFVILGAAALVKDGNMKEVTQLAGKSLRAVCVGWGLVRSLTAQLLSGTVLKPVCKLKKILSKSKLVALRPWCQITAVWSKFYLVGFFQVTPKQNTVNIPSGKRHHIIWKRSGLWFERPDLLTKRPAVELYWVSSLGAFSKNLTPVCRHTLKVQLVFALLKPKVKVTSPVKITPCGFFAR